MIKLSFQEVIRARYSFPRIQWLLGIVSATSLLYLTSEELWTSVDSYPFPELSEFFYIYILFFGGLFLAANLYDVTRITDKRPIIASVTIISGLIDLTIISLGEFFVLLALNVFPQSYICGLELLLLGALPASLGSIILSSLTTETLKQRAKKMYEEVRAMRKQLETLEKQHKEANMQLKELERKRKEFEESFEEK